MSQKKLKYHKKRDREKRIVKDLMLRGNLKNFTKLFFTCPFIGVDFDYSESPSTKRLSSAYFGNSSNISISLRISEQSSTEYGLKLR